MYKDTISCCYFVTFLIYTYLSSTRQNASHSICSSSVLKEIYFFSLWLLQFLGVFMNIVHEVKNNRILHFHKNNGYLENNVASCFNLPKYSVWYIQHTSSFIIQHKLYHVYCTCNFFQGR